MNERELIINCEEKLLGIEGTHNTERAIELASNAYLTGIVIIDSQCEDSDKKYLRFGKEIVDNYLTTVLYDISELPFELIEDEELNERDIPENFHNLVRNCLDIGEINHLPLEQEVKESLERLFVTLQRGQIVELRSIPYRITEDKAIYIKGEFAEQLKNIDQNLYNISTAIEGLLNYAKGRGENVEGLILIPISEGIRERSDNYIKFRIDENGDITLLKITNLPFAFIDNKRLSGMGVRPHHFSSVRNCRNPDDISNLDLGVRVRDRLKKWLDEVRKKLISYKKNLEYKADNIEHLDRYYRRDITKLLLKLYGDQKELVDKEARTSPIIVKGAVGSGKTTIALYRMRRLAKEGSQCLYLTYNKSLRKAAESLLRALIGEDIPYDIKVSNIHRYCKNFLATTVGIKISINRKQDKFLREAVGEISSFRQSRLFDRKVDFWKYEIDNIIKGRTNGTKEEYYRISGKGRGFPLGRPAREVVWEVYRNYEDKKGRNYYDFSDLPLLTLSNLNSRDFTHLKYDYVFIDEAQDLTLNELKVATKFCRNPKGLFVVADAAQSIYQNGFNWNDLDITVGGGNVNVLVRNHRNTRQILSAAQSFVMDNSKLLNDENIIPPELSTKEGPKPKIEGRFSNIREQGDWITNDIKARIMTGECIAKNIAIITPWGKHAWMMTQKLKEMKISSVMYEDEMDLDSDSIKCLTIHSSKGLEFPLVYLLGIDQIRIPGKITGSSEEEQQVYKSNRRKLLYVGMTRAMNELIITCNSRNSSEFLNDIDADLVI